MSQLDQSRIVQLLEEMVVWLKIIGSDQAKKLLAKTLDTEVKKIVYQLSDGKTNSSYVASYTRLSQGRISQLWKEWSTYGIGHQVSAKGGSRFRRTFDLVSLGILQPSVLSARNQPSTNNGHSIMAVTPKKQ